MSVTTKTEEEIKKEEEQKKADAEKSKSDDENKTYSKAELDKIIAQRDEAKNKARALEVETNKVKADLKRIEEDKLKASGDLEALLKSKETELEQTIAEKQSLENAKIELETLQTEIKKDLLEQLSKEHLKIAEKLSIQDLKEYVALNSKHTKGMDAGRIGKGSIDLTGKTYDDFTTDKLKELRESNPEGYKKLYKDKYGRFPVLKN